MNGRYDCINGYFLGFGIRSRKLSGLGRGTVNYGLGLWTMDLDSELWTRSVDLDCELETWSFYLFRLWRKAQEGQLTLEGFRDRMAAAHN